MRKYKTTNIDEVIRLIEHSSYATVLKIGDVYWVNYQDVQMVKKEAPAPGPPVPLPPPSGLPLVGAGGEIKATGDA